MNILQWLFFDIGSTLVDESKAYEHRIKDIIAGFNKTRLFYTQGDYGLFQCSVPCCDETFDNEEIIRGMVDKQTDMCIPSELLPFSAALFQAKSNKRT